MEKLLFANYQVEVSLNCFVPNNHLKDHNTKLFNDQFKILSLEEKLLLVVLDRDGYFYSDVKPAPKFLLTLKEHKIYIQAFSMFNPFSTSYGCFLKSFVLNNPGFKPMSFLK